MWSPSGLFVVALVIVCITQWVYRWRNPMPNVKLPPGSMGLPFIGETLQLFASQSSFDIHPFIKKKMNRYGPIFKTNLVRRPIVITTDPEFSHFLFLQEGNSTETYIPFLESSRNNFEKNNMNIHKYLRNMVLGYFGTEKQKEKLLTEMQEMVGRNIAIWSKQPSVELKQVTANMAFGYATKKILSYDSSKFSENLEDTFIGFLRGLMAFPLNIPGTAYHKCEKDKKKVMAILKDLVTERLNFGNANQYGDFLDVIIEEMKKDEPVFDIDGATYIVFAILLASFETISLALTLAIKFISEDSAVLTELTEEHEKIIKNRENVNSAITWNEYKSMTFTANIIGETLRLGNLSQLIFRRAIKDIEVNGYTIPSGWGIIVYPPAIHLNPYKYEDPLLFNPWRWKGQGSNTASKTFMPFGGGCRLCAGAGYTKLQMTIVLHLLVTKYRWTKIKGGEVIQRLGRVGFPNGLHIKVTERI
ncbi:Cytochrome p450 [Thalictrum thalictroides]|uniref:Cytochrome p450 n=1 Tax=Thalictrum thalictroides TaxID=46969 RepID=A0A7J6US22_THATH|nr:Cytochrome p450 [Thalictrum thalictroides]